MWDDYLHVSHCQANDGNLVSKGLVVAVGWREVVPTLLLPFTFASPFLLLLSPLPGHCCSSYIISVSIPCFSFPAALLPCSLLASITLRLTLGHSFSHPTRLNPVEP
jgi:hypothetical protein